MNLKKVSAFKKVGAKYNLVGINNGFATALLFYLLEIRERLSLGYQPAFACNIRHISKLCDNSLKSVAFF